jgi:hypothetical protein
MTRYKAVKDYPDYGIEKGGMFIFNKRLCAYDYYEAEEGVCYNEFSEKEVNLFLFAGILVERPEPEFIPGQAYKVRVTNNFIRFVSGEEPFEATWMGNHFKEHGSLLRFKPEWVEVLESEAGDD